VTSPNARQSTKQDLEAFVAKVQAFIDPTFSDGYRPTLTIDMGPKYVRIVENRPGQRSVYGFVEIATGNILKSAGWKAPAKHARGNIHDDDCLKACTPYGIVYLR
jgi:hypothetical protein